LQGLNKAETAAQYGDEQVKIWRRSFDVQPPALAEDDERNPAKNVQYRAEGGAELPLTESLKETIARAVPYYEAVIKPEIAAGQRVLIAAHGNSLRALVKYFENLSEAELLNLNIPTGTPLVYEFDDQFAFVRKYYLGNEDAIQAKMAAVANQGKAK
jgi:2,3-bisphosphoglycerate-dependent phosphoglycerate mutase